VTSWSRRWWRYKTQFFFRGWTQVHYVDEMAEHDSRLLTEARRGEHRGHDVQEQLCGQHNSPMSWQLTRKY